MGYSLGLFLSEGNKTVSCNYVLRKLNFKNTPNFHVHNALQELMFVLTVGMARLQVKHGGMVSRLDSSCDYTE
jgi:hypothetical protein